MLDLSDLCPSKNKGFNLLFYSFLVDSVNLYLPLPSRFEYTGLIENIGVNKRMFFFRKLAKASRQSQHSSSLDVSRKSTGVGERSKTKPFRQSD